jgi:hypothetical protein
LLYPLPDTFDLKVDPPVFKIAQFIDNVPATIGIGYFLQLPNYYVGALVKTNVILQQIVEHFLAVAGHADFSGGDVSIAVRNHFDRKVTKLGFSVLLDCLPDCKFYISKKRDNLDLEPVQSSSYRTATASTCVDLVAVFFFVVALQKWTR